MADPKLVEILRQGGETWNRWREQQSRNYRLHLMEFYPREIGLDEIEQNVYFWPTDLSGADLREADLYNANLIFVNLSNADLSGANLHRANLTSAVLSNANLSRAILHRANLHRANLICANLSEASLRYANLNMTVLYRANLQRADLTYADLKEAELNEADLSMADLSGANLMSTEVEKANWTNAIIGLTQFDNLDLRGIIGLETVQPLAPSPMGLDTIYRSHGQIPESFLRRAGMPETFITNMRALVDSMSPIEFYSCFISYSHQNEDFAKRLHADLQREGVRCWFAPEDLRIGEKIRPRIDESIRRYDKLLLVLSAYSVASQWVEQEVETALAKERRENRLVVFPVRLDSAVMEIEGGWPALICHTRNIGDFTCWKEYDAYQRAFERLMRDLKSEAAQREK